jgi:HEAT repeat protein
MKATSKFNLPFSAIFGSGRWRTTRSLLTGATVAVLILSTGLAWPAREARGGTQDDAIEMWGKRYNQAYKDLRNGHTFEKIEAARLMGQHKKMRYIRPLATELLRDLDNPVYRQIPTNDPYVKSEIAWALGQIGHKHAVPALLQALQSTVAIIEEEFKANEERRQKEKELADSVAQAAGEDPADPQRIRFIVLDQSRPGPFLLEGYSFPYSPDMLWSVSDEFKDVPSVDTSAEDHRIRLLGANYMNLVRSIMVALGEIADDSAVDGIDPHPGLAGYLTHRIPFVRSFAAHALGKIGTLKAASLIDQHYPNEQVDEVKVRAAFAVVENDKTRVEYYRELLRYLEIDDDRVRFLAAVAMRSLAMGESLDDLREAISIEHDPVIRSVLQQAIHNAEIDSIIPVNY